MPSEGPASYTQTSPHRHSSLTLGEIALRPRADSQLPASPRGEQRTASGGRAIALLSAGMSRRLDMTVASVGVSEPPFPHSIDLSSPALARWIRDRPQRVSHRFLHGVPAPIDVHASSREMKYVHLVDTPKRCTAAELVSARARLHRSTVSYGAPGGPSCHRRAETSSAAVQNAPDLAGMQKSVAHLPAAKR